MKKVLFTATVDSHILQFHLPFLRMFKENGYEVHVATNGDEKIPYCDVKHVVSFERSPLKPNNLKAIEQLRKIVNTEKFDIIHTHTPMGSVVTRLAAKKARKKFKTRVIYTAHGLHFFKGAPLKNWIMFYPVEKYLSKYTDTLILINQEDYDLCKRKFKKCNDIQYVPGVGIDEAKFSFEMTGREKHELRESIGLKDDDFVMIYPAELSKRKRQLWLINAIEHLLKEYKDIHLLLPGKDSLNGKCQELVKNLNLENQIHFLGYRNDIPKLLKISDISVSSANQEGLPVNIMEAMYVGLPIVASNCRGNRDLVKNHVNGYLISLDDSIRYAECIEKLYNNRDKENKFGQESQIIIKDYLLNKIRTDMKKIYFMSNDLISIIIPVYNAEKYIKECLTDILNQTYKNIEIIIINDGSIDKTDSIIKKNIKNKNNVIYINQDNQGVSYSRNVGINKANGKYLCFVDCDDKISKEYISKLYYGMQINKSDMSFFAISKKLIHKKNGFYDKQRNSRKYTKFVNYSLKKELINSPCGKLYNTSILKDKKIYFDQKVNIGEDLIFNLKYVKYINSIYFSKEKIYDYLQNDNSLTNKIDISKYNKLSYVNKEISKILCNRKKYERSLSYIKIKNIFSCFITFLRTNNSSKKKFKEYYNYIYENEGKIFINIFDFKMFLVSILYNLKFTSFIYYLTKKQWRKKI